MGVNAAGATNLLTIRNDTTLPKMTFPSGIWTNNFSTNITDTELFYLDGVSSNIQTQLNSLTNSVSTNTSNIATNTTQLSTNTTNIATNTSDISSLTGQQTSNTNAINVNTANISTNTGNISSIQGQQNTNTFNISALTSQQSTNTSNISTNTTAISDIKTKYDFTGSVANGKILIGSGSNYSVGELLSSDNSITITKSAGGIDLIAPSSSSLSAGTGINITTNVINYDINKETAYTSPVAGDLMLMYDTTNTATKKITFSDFNAGLQTQITNLTTQQNTNTSAIATNASDIASNTSSITSLTTQQTTNTNNINTNTTNITNLTSQQNTNTTNIANLTTQQNTNTTAIASNTTNIATNTTNIATNTSDISTNTSNISTNTTNITNLTTQQNTNTSAIATNTTNIATNTTNIATNTSNIATNAAAISNLVSTANSTNFGTTASSGVTLANSSQSLALNSASMNCISAGKNFFRSNLSSGLGFQIQGFNSGGVSYTSVIEVHNVASGFPFLNLLMGNGFSINQYTGQSRNLIVDTNGKLNISNDMPITLTAGEGIALNANAIDVDISKQVAITTPANDDELLIERNTGVINKISYGNLGIGVSAGNAIAVAGTTVNGEISKPSTITTPASGDLLLLEQASDGVLKNITYNNLISGVDVTTATSISTAAAAAVTVGNANNQTMNLVGSTINVNGNAKTKFRSTASTGTSFEVDGYNSNDVAYYSSLKLDNSNVAGVRPTVDILGSSGFYGGVGQNLTIDANGKIDWVTPSSTGTVLEQYNTTTDLLNSVQTSGKMALVLNPLKLWVYANLSSGLVWRSLSFDTATNLSLNSSTYQLNSGGSTSFSSGDVIAASTTGDVVKITVKVNDDLTPTVVNSLTSSTQTALDGWNGSQVVSMANAFSITDNGDGTYTYEGQVKTKNETDTTAITYTITDINSSTILTFNYSIQNAATTGFGTGAPSIGGYYAVFSVGAAAGGGGYFVQSSTSYSLQFVGGNQTQYVCNAGTFSSTTTPTNSSNNNPMIFHYATRTYNNQNIAVFYATTYNGSPGSYTAYSNRHFAVGFNTANLTFVSAGTDEYYMYSGGFQMSNSSSYSNKIGFASGQNTTYTDSQAKWKFYKVA